MFYQLASRDPIEGAADTETTLLLPPTPYNHADPALPPHLTTPQINGHDNEPATGSAPPQSQQRPTGRARRLS